MEISLIDLENDIRKRILKRLSKLDFTPYEVKEFYIGGNSLNEPEPNDFDLFPIVENQFEHLDNKVEGYIHKTANAITYENNGEIVQFCKHYKESLEKLIEGFDFAHIKVGAHIRVSLGSEHWARRIEIVKVYISPDYVASRILKRSFYTGNEDNYPISSIARAFKYHARGDIENPWDVLLEILTHLIRRGFKGYKDFLEQMDAIDIQMVDEERIKDRSLLARQLFELLKKPETPTHFDDGDM